MGGINQPNGIKVLQKPNANGDVNTPPPPEQSDPSSTPRQTLLVVKLGGRACQDESAILAPIGMAPVSAYSGTRIRGQTLGLIGFGSVGRAVSIRAKFLGFNVMFYDPFIVDGYDITYGVTRVNQLNDLLAKSDCLCVSSL
ncbi:unnamed protein product [Orchesella dallaii]|uniref:D-isomer specific 2-hydroxyacid dehydrogenase NAD-binding domain-containing protein n=1 Tax=Orchesella dallaii TaxID=48710 RepID=A0ABP1RK98_9HEXA